MNDQFTPISTELRQLLSVQEAQELLGGISRTTLYGLVKVGEIDIVKIGSRSFVLKSSIEEFICRLGGKRNGI